MEKQEINSRLAAIESEIKAIPKIQADVGAIQAEISDLKEGQKRLEYAVAGIQASQAEICGMLELLVALPDKVEKNGRRISWLYGMITATVLAGVYIFIPGQ